MAVSERRWPAKASPVALGVRAWFSAVRARVSIPSCLSLSLCLSTICLTCRRG